MKVLHVINALQIGGAEKMLIEQLPILNKSIDVDLLLIGKSANDLVRSLSDKFNGTIIQYNNSVYNPLVLLKLRKMFFNKYDIIHVHLFPSLYWIGIAKFMFRSSSRLVFTEHSTNNSRINSVFFRLVDKLIYSIYDLVIAITPQVQTNIINKLKIEKSKIKVIYNGVNLEKFSKLTQIDISVSVPEDSVILIQVSRFSEAKDQNTVIRSLLYLPSNYFLLLVGSGKLQQKSEELVASLNLKDRVLFLGNRLDIPELLNQSDIVIQSSNWEGFGLAAVEGMASFKPVIASDVAGLAEIVSGYGLLFNKGDSEHLSKQILSLKSKADYISVAKSCKDRSCDFNLLTTCNQLIECYNTLLKPRK